MKMEIGVDWQPVSKIERQILVLHGLHLGINNHVIAMYFTSTSISVLCMEVNKKINVWSVNIALLKKKEEN